MSSVVLNSQIPHLLTMPNNTVNRIHNTSVRQVCILGHAPESMETVRPSLSTQKANDSFTYRILQCQRSQVLRPSVRLPRFRHEKQRCVFPLLGNERRSTIPPFLQARKNYVSKFMCMRQQGPGAQLGADALLKGIRLNASVSCSQLKGTPGAPE